MKKIKIDMFQEYVSKLIFRCCVFLVVLLAYLFEPDYFDLILTKKVEMQWLLSGLSSEQIRQMLGQYNILWVYVVWAILMVSMVSQMFPQNKRITMGSKKASRATIGGRSITASWNCTAMFKKIIWRRSGCC